MREGKEHYQGVCYKLYISLHDSRLCFGCSKTGCSRPLVLSFGLSDHSAACILPNFLTSCCLRYLIRLLVASRLHVFVQE